MKNRGMFALVAACAVVVLGSGRSHGATMTFDDLGGVEDRPSYSEAGILAEAIGSDEPWSWGWGRINSYQGRPAAHVEDGGWGFAFGITFSMGRKFDAIGFDLYPTGFFYQLCTTPSGSWPICTDTNAPFPENVQVSGFRDGGRVAWSILDLGNTERWVALGAAYRKLDYLVIEALPFPSGRVVAVTDGEVTTMENLDFPTFGFDVDNVTLSPVPLPATVLSLAAALGLLGATRRRAAAVAPRF